MPWRETSPMDQRLRFIADLQREYLSLSELCRRFGVSRKTAYKWIERYEADGPAGLVDRSRRPQACAHQTPASVVEALLECRRRHPTWGAKKLLSILSRSHPDWEWPARSTCSDLIKRHGLVTGRRRRQYPGHPGRPMTPMDEPNAIWTADFKGQFRSRDKVEGDATLVQALPVVIVRNKTGDVLRLRRKEASDSNPLHEKLVIWAGGHVRIEDGSNGEAVLRCAIRELQEELRLSVEADELKLLGSVYVPTGERTSKHVAVVYEWRADSYDVTVALSNAEFFERRGNSLSGRFVSLDTLVNDVLNSKIEEVWSQEIIREFLAPDASVFPPRLF